MVSFGLSAVACCLWFVVGIAFGFHIAKDAGTMKHAGIELRLSVDGVTTLQGDSDFLHYCAKYSGAPIGDWSHVSAWPTCYGVVRVEVRALELEDLDGELAELAELDVDQAAELELGGIIGAAAAAAVYGTADPNCSDPAANAAAPVPEVDTGAANLAELPTQDPPARPKRAAGQDGPAGLGTVIGRIARRARFRSGR